jgi:hypothetical protein
MRAKALEPVTLVRSPTLTNSESSSMVKGSRPDRRISSVVRDLARATVATVSAMALMWRRGAAAAAGDVDEARFGEFLQQGRGVGGRSSKPVSLIGLGRPAFG